MNICSNCHQALGEELSICPVCGAWMNRSRTAVDEYRIDSFVHEGHGAIGYKAHREGDAGAVFIRVFKPESGITPETAARLRLELETLHNLPAGQFVRHIDLRRSHEGYWYRVSEWLDAEPWGDLIGSGYFLSTAHAVEIFLPIAEGIAQLHAMGCAIPHLTLDDLIAVRGVQGSISVKIDYKVSRFINPSLPSPRPELAALLAAHPDIRAGRPLDSRTDVWSMGRVFALLVTGEDDVPQALEKLERSHAPERLRRLLRQMLEENPDLRPTSAEVAAALRDVPVDEAGEVAAAPSRKPIWQSSLALVLVLLLAMLAGAALWLQSRYGTFSRDSSTILGRYAERYHGSVAFVASTYQLEVGDKPVAVSGAEGTAFLVTSDGYLLTNRHVACPWLEDPDIGVALARVNSTGKEVRLRYRILLWFDGEKALRVGRKSLGGNTIDDLIGDRYFPENAHSTGGSPSVTIAGILPPPRTLRERLRSPLADDIALLKIDQVPKGILPVPLPRPGMARPRTLTPVLALGFPLGSRENLAEEVVTSATLGNVRRSFENVHQVSASLHPGNSGGPVIDVDGRLLGIASGIASLSDSGSGLSDFGMVLPVERALPLLEALQHGQQKWDGLPDYGLGGLRMRVAQAAEKNDWAEARKLAAAHRKENRDPKLLELMTLVEYGAGNLAGARETLASAVSETPDDPFLRFLRHVLSWKESAGKSAPEPAIRDATWDSPAEFYRFIARVLSGEAAGPEVPLQWEDGSEKAVLTWALGQRQRLDGHDAEAVRLFRRAAAESGQDTPERLLALADLSVYEKGKSGPAKSSAADENKRLVRSRMGQALLARALAATPAGSEVQAFEQLATLDPEDSTVLIELAFRYAGQASWKEAAARLAVYWRRPHRACANSMAAALLRAELPALQGNVEEARRTLEELSRHTDWPWYPAVARDLLGGGEVGAGPAREPPEVLTLGVARGLWAEARRDVPAALRHYRTALDSYLSSWSEYRLAEARIHQLRQPQENAAGK